MTLKAGKISAISLNFNLKNLKSIHLLVCLSVRLCVSSDGAQDPAILSQLIRICSTLQTGFRLFSTLYFFIKIKGCAIFKKINNINYNFLLSDLELDLAHVCLFHFLYVHEKMIYNVKDALSIESCNCKSFSKLLYPLQLGQTQN